MARGPDGKGGGAGFSLSDQLFNAESLSDLARDYARLPGFDSAAFLGRVLPGLAGRGLLERLDWIADCIEAQLPRGFPAMADALETALPPPLDPTLTDDDFGRFIHAVPGILAVRHGLEHHRDRALDLLHAATQRFSMEFYIRPFLNRWPQQTLARLTAWSEDPNYHVRRLVSEGTRPRLPWARNITLPPERALPLLDRLHADPTRYVTRSVANHLNDLTKPAPQAVIDRLRDWHKAGRQNPKELDWMTRHALRSAVKRKDRAALALLGFHPGQARGRLILDTGRLAIGDTLTLRAEITAASDLPVMVDYRIVFARPRGPAEKVFKLRQGRAAPDRPLQLEKRHRFKGDATTFQLYPGPHRIILQVNGEDLDSAEVVLTQG